VAREVHTSLQHVAMSAGVAWRAETFGHFHYCAVLERCDEPISVMLRSLSEAVDGSGAGSEQPLGLQSLGDFSAALAARWHEQHPSPPQAAVPDLLVCSHWWLLCAALRHSKTVVASLWVHLLIERPLLLTPAPWQSAVLAQLREAAASVTVDIVLSYVPIYAEFYRQLAGVAVPVLPPISLHVEGMHSSMPSTRASSPTALFARTQYTASLQGIAFGHVLQLYMAEDLMRGSRWRVFTARWDDPSGRLSYEEMARFDAAIFVPSQRQQMMFSDLYAMHLPTFVPGARLFAKTLASELEGDAHPRWAGFGAAAEFKDAGVQLGTAWRFAEPASNEQLLRNQSSGLSPARLLFLSEPLNQRDSNGNTWTSLDWRCDSPEKLASWFWLTDYANYPHVQHFDSIPGLLLGLVGLDLPLISRGMRRFHAKLRARSLGFWSSVLKAAAEQK
jgi:hypothetical protein